MPDTFSAETQLKLERLRAFMARHALDGVVLNSRANFAWLTGGGDNHVVSQDDAGIASLVVMRRSAFLVTNRIEADRMMREQPVKGFSPRIHAWSEPAIDIVTKLAGGKAFASDDPSLALMPLPDDFSATCRTPLLRAEIDRYAVLGAECSDVMERIARQLDEGDVDRAVEGDMARELLARGIQPHVLLAGFDDRIRAFRHPVPSGALRKHAMLVICGQRHGLIANLTRVVHLGRLSTEIRERHESVCDVECALWDATQVGVTWSDALKKGLAAYRAHGFGQEWKLHHQGGPTGYAGREFMVTPHETRTVLDGQAVAWNPSITGVKSEDTFILRDDEKTVLTACSAQWPAIDVKRVDGSVTRRPGILVK